MKTILWVIIILSVLNFQGFIQGQGMVPVMPVEPYLVNKILQIGPAHLPEMEYQDGWKGWIRKINLNEELEQKLIEIRLIQQAV